MINYKYLTIALLLFGSVSAYAQVAVIVNTSVSENSIDSRELTNIYTLKVKTWSNGTAITPITLKADNSISQKFFSELGRSYMEMNKLWMRLMLTGEGQVPAGFASDDEILEKVASTPGAIGFISTNKISNKVKVLMKMN